MKTLAIRLEDDVHAQLTVLAQLAKQTVTDAIRSAIESYIEAQKARPEVSARAEAVLADIEREAAARREAIAALFGGTSPTAAEEPVEPSGQEPRPRASRSKGGASST